jgi:hypothetical protein
VVGIQGLGMHRPDARRWMGPALWFLGLRPSREAVFRSEGMLEPKMGLGLVRPQDMREAALRSEELLESSK